RKSSVVDNPRCNADVRFDVRDRVGSDALQYSLVRPVSLPNEMQERLVLCRRSHRRRLANDHTSLPVAYRLYLPQSWANDDERRTKSGVPKELEFKTKPQIALEQTNGLAPRVCHAVS